MTPRNSVEQSVRDRLIKHITFAGGHAEIWQVFEDAQLFGEVVEALAYPWRSLLPTKVVGIEARGFILGAAVAHELGTGFVGIRKDGSLFAGAKVETMTNRDSRGSERRLRARRDSLSPDDQVILVDDWCETGNQALAAFRLIESCDARVLGISVIVDDAAPEVTRTFPRYEALIRAGELRGGSAPRADQVP